MIKTVLRTVFVAGTLVLAGCSNSTAEKADEATQSAAADAEANAEAVRAEAAEAKNSVEANVQNESKKKAAAD